ncbi:MAG: hypothetical protein IPK81_03870 [Rhodospirillales bacterium]|nr:MAG: hypothetical protein IPK81_03870 [Rhodospirillales bacterium]
MRKPSSVKGLEALSRARLSRHFFLRDFLYSEVAAVHGLRNVPDDPDLAIEAGGRLCQELLEPLQAAFGRIAIRSAYRSVEMNALCNRLKLGCARNEHNFARHIWDRRDADGFMGAMACVVVPWFVDHDRSGGWRAMAWWIHDHLPYSELEFYPRLAAFNIGWHERPRRTIHSQIPPLRGYLTKPGMANHAGDHASLYPGFPPAPVLDQPTASATKRSTSAASVSNDVTSR